MTIVEQDAIRRRMDIREQVSTLLENCIDLRPYVDVAISVL